MPFEKYGTLWDDATHPVELEMGCIIRGGRWKTKAGKECGIGLAEHYIALQKLLMPWKDWHRWNLLLQRQFVENKITAVMGPASSGKSREMGDYALTDWFVYPDCTTVLVSSTTMPALERRIWGEIKKQFHAIKELYPWLPGNWMESKKCVVLDAKTERGRDFRNGIQAVACLKGSTDGTFVGLGNYIGTKNKRVRLIGDELQFMPKGYIDIINNLDKTPEDFKFIGGGNPKGYDDALSRIAEPLDGWTTMDRTEKTKQWKTRYPNGTCVQLVGTDSPNYDVAENVPPPYPYLIKRRDIESDLKYYGRNSLQFAMMDLGMMPMSGVANRIITRQMCVDNHAMESAIFNGKVTKLFALDAAYGSVGGDRCVGGEWWFGEGLDGKEIIALIGSPILVPVSWKKVSEPEDQIALYVKDECLQRGVPPEHVYFDSTGRGSLGTSFGRNWSVAVNPVEFGGKPTKRPVSQVDRRPSDQAYGKMVTELWYSSRLVIEGGQMRGLNEEMVEDGQTREYMMIDSHKIDVESKVKTKERMGRSPDLWDMLVIAIEGARRLGFQIANLNPAGDTQTIGWTVHREKFQKLNARKRLSYAT